MGRDLKKIAIFASGSGSNAVNIINHARNHLKYVKIECVITDHSDAKVREKMNDSSMICEFIPFKKKSGDSYLEAKKNHEKQILEVCQKYQIDWVFLAGYMRILSADFLNHFFDVQLNVNRVINIHPSLLPKFPGKDAYGQAFHSSDLTSGVTIHFVDSGVDTGSIIAQELFEKEQSDTLETFKARGLKLEHRMYKEVLSQLNFNTLKKK